MESNLPDRVDQTQHSHEDLASSFGLISGEDIHASPDQQVVDTGGEVVVAPVVIPPVIPYHPYWATIRKDGVVWEAEFTQGYVDDLARYINHQVALVNGDNPAPGVSFETAGFVTITSAETWGVNIKTDTDGVITGIPTFQVVAPGTKSQEHREITIDDPLGQVGDYWIKVVYFEEIDQRMTYTYTLDHNVVWGYRAIHNTDTGDATVFKKYDDSLGFTGYYLLRTITGTDAAEPSASSGEEKVDLWLKATNENDTIRLTGSAIVPSSTSTHPWKVTATGGNTVTVDAGCVMSYAESSFTLKNFKKYDGATTPTVTGAGFIYGAIDPEKATASDININEAVIGGGGGTIEAGLFRMFPDITGGIVVDFATEVPVSTSQFYFEIAEVSLDGGNAVVDYQTLTHNPTLSSYLEGT